jgi:hypothetical protein
MRRLDPRIVVVAILIFASGAAEAASCRSYPVSALSAIRPRVEALRTLEREAADRVAGLDTRTFDHLLEQTRAAAAMISDPGGSKDRAGRCRHYVPPVRRFCVAAAFGLVRLIVEQAAGTATPASKRRYAEAMPPCERWVGLTPVSTIFRTTD